MQRSRRGRHSPSPDPASLLSKITLKSSVYQGRQHDGRGKCRVSPEGDSKTAVSDAEDLLKQTRVTPKGVSRGLREGSAKALPTRKRPSVAVSCVCSPAMKVQGDTQAKSEGGGMVIVEAQPKLRQHGRVQHCRFLRSTSSYESPRRAHTRVAPGRASRCHRKGWTRTSPMRKRTDTSSVSRERQQDVNRASRSRNSGGQKASHVSAKAHNREAVYVQTQQSSAHRLPSVAQGKHQGHAAADAEKYMP